MSNKHKVKRLTRYNLEEEYGMTEEMIQKYLPEPRKMRKNHHGKPRMMWEEFQVKQVLRDNPELKAKLDAIMTKKKERILKEKGAIEFLSAFSPENLFEDGKLLKRKFYLHVGPTNSGKTYHALQALKQAESGVYLGPLRLLALEVFENLNRDGIPCSLLTGEECYEMPGSDITASTIELLDYYKHYDVAVIDEAQMLEDPTRGAKWLHAISLVDADEVYICLAPEALPLVENMLKKMEAPYEVIKHERLVPLKFDGEFTDIKEVEPGDALITFSRKKVLEIAAKFEQHGINASVIYGALPPGSRREEVRRFASGETRVVVATDAIGMGISLPIRRIIFTETEKFDGKRRRPLNVTEIKQIAGRAGRFGKYDLGLVKTMMEPERIERALRKDAPLIERLTIAFPSEALEFDYPLADMLEIWNHLPPNDLFSREDMTEPLFLLKHLRRIPPKTPRQLIFDMITCPVDTGDDDLVDYWASIAMRVFKDQPISRPSFPTESLEDCEFFYHAYDVYHQVLRRIGIEDDCQEEKELLIDKINEFLKSEKTEFLKRCRICGREMSIGETGSVCERCYKRGLARRYWQ